MNFVSCVDGNVAVNVHHPLHTKWLNQPLAFFFHKSGNLYPLNRIMIGMFSYVQYKTM